MPQIRTVANEDRDEMSARLLRLGLGDACAASRVLLRFPRQQRDRSRRPMLCFIVVFHYALQSHFGGFAMRSVVGKFGDNSYGAGVQIPRRINTGSNE